MDWLGRLKEPSTWAGFGILYVAAAAIFDGSVEWLTGLPAVLAALIAIVKGEAPKQ